MSFIIGFGLFVWGFGVFHLGVPKAFLTEILIPSLIIAQVG